MAAFIAALALWLDPGDGGEAPAPISVANSSLRQPVGHHCTTVRSGTQAVQSAVSAAAAGTVVCLADGVYGRLALPASRGGPRITVRAERPGKAVIAGADLNGSNLTLARFRIRGEVEVAPGTTKVSVSHNRISGGYFGVQAGPTTTTTVNDVSIVGNKFVGPFGEDAIRLNRYHDANGDGVGALVEGNEFTNVRENGNHSDCLQAVWVGDHLVFRKNYLHDNRCQGFFVKDQASPVNGILVENNLFLRNGEPCDPPDSGCGQPGYFQVFGPYTHLVMRGNTIWGGETIAAFQNGTGRGSLIEENVVFKLWTSTDLSSLVYRNNTRCQRQASPGGAWPASIPGEVRNCRPAFAAPSSDDYRLAGGRGVDWAPSGQRYGF